MGSNAELSASSTFIHARTDDDNCVFPGNADLYGLGIRLGVYLQWVSTLLIYACCPKGRRGHYEAYLIFVIALLVTTFVVTQYTETKIVDISILSYIIFGGVCIVMLTPTGTNEDDDDDDNTPREASGRSWSGQDVVPEQTKKHTRGKSRCVSRTSEFFASLVIGVAGFYYAWFWLHGIKTFSTGPCGTYGFFFTKTSLPDGDASIVLGLGAVAFGLCGIGNLLSMVSVLLYGRSKDVESVTRSMRVLETMTLFNTSKVPPDVYFRILDLMHKLQVWNPISSLIFTILGIELTIRWNHMEGMYTIDSTGQMIPFVIGIASFASVLYQPVREQYAKRIWRPERSCDETVVDGNHDRDIIRRPEPAVTKIIA